jgi:hypothetical protein
MDNTQTELGRFHSDGQWFSDHYEELAKKYPDQWVAVYNQEVVGASPDSDALFAALKKKGVPINHAFFKYLSSEEELWIFAA